MCVHMYTYIYTYTNMHMSMHRCVFKCVYLHVLEMRGHRPRKTKTNFYSSDLFRGVGF